MPESGYLTHTEYKALRQTLGFTLEEAKAFHKVQNISTIKRWENGYSLVSKLACDKICELAQKIDWTINQAIEQAKKADNKDCVITLVVYPDSCYKQYAIGFENLPNNVHKAMISRTYLALRNLSFKVGIVEFSPQDYFVFMAKNNLKDSPATRAAWAADYYEKITIQ